MPKRDTFQVAIPGALLGVSDFNLVYDQVSSSFFKEPINKNGQTTSNSTHDSTTNRITINSLEMKDINHVCCIDDLPKSFPLTEKYVKAYKQLNLAGKNRNDLGAIPWFDCIPTESYKSDLKEFTTRIRTSLDNLDLSYYSNIFKRVEPLLTQDLYPAKVDYRTLSNHLLYQEDKSLNHNVHLQTFMPENGYARPVKYSRTKTTTGRLTVVDGPDILLLPKKFRNVIVSRHGDQGSIVYLDFKALEPRVLLAAYTNSLIGYPSPICYNPDIYTSIIELTELKDKGIPRSVIKFITIEKLYGAMDSTIIRNLLEKTNDKSLTAKQCQDLINVIDSVFSITELKQSLGQQFKANEYKFIENFYGRKIRCEESYKLINYVVQSTAVDVALMAFQNMTNWLNENDLTEEMTPLFVLHDALVLDVHNDAKKRYLKKLIKVGSQAPLGFPQDITFFLEEE